MLLHESVKPISYVKAHASELINSLKDGGGPVVVTQNGEARAVLQSMEDYENTQESLALLKMIAMSEKAVERGESQGVDEAFDDIWREIAEAKKETR
jgi:prevent-host-death family protein